MYDVSMIDGHIDEPKMTDNDVIKALNDCMNTECRDCPLSYNQCEIEHGGVPTFIVNLINRQKAEIERLKQNLKEAHIDIRETKDQFELLDIEHEAIRISAYKEFAERLKECFHTETYYHSDSIKQCIDRVEKEMGRE